MGNSIRLKCDTKCKLLVYKFAMFAGCDAVLLNVLNVSNHGRIIRESVRHKAFNSSVILVKPIDL